MTDTLRTIHADLVALAARVGALLPVPILFEASTWQLLDGAPLDVARLGAVTFASDFAQATAWPIVPGDSTAAAPWYAGAQGGPYGLANVGYSVRPDVYSLSERLGLTISANQTPGADPTKVGGWYSGHVQTVNTHGQGFAQRLGYFEARMVFPNSYMAWPAFWLKPRAKWLDLLALELEIDVVEWYGPNDAKRIHATLHQAGLPHHGIQPGVDADLTADWHRYGVLLDEDWITIYVDRHAAARHPMPALHAAQEWYPQLTLSVNGHPNEVSHVAEALNPMRLHVSEVVVWSLR